MHSGESEFALSLDELNLNDLAELRIVGKEKEHYNILDDMLVFVQEGRGKSVELSSRAAAMTDDWNAMLGGSSSLPEVARPYLKALASGDRDGALMIYLLLSPMFLFMHALHEISRGAYRNAVTACARFCERIAKNLLWRIDEAYGTSFSLELDAAKFENKNGRVKGELEKNGFELADDLFMTMKKIYRMRDKRGPHDVPPPEPIQAKMCINDCLPAYIDYLTALDFLDIKLGNVRDEMVRIFDSLTRTKLAIIFGEEDKMRLSASDCIVNFLYKEGFFGQRRSLNEVVEEMTRRHLTHADSVVANSLKRLSVGKDAILTRKKHQRSYFYYERVPPSEYFRTEL